MIYLHGWYNAAYRWAREEGLARADWRHVPIDNPLRALAGARPGRFVCVYGWTLDAMAEAEDRGFTVEMGPDPGPGPRELRGLQADFEMRDPCK